MPLAALERPALGLSLLKARLCEDGFRCDIRYPAFWFAELVGLEEYLWLHCGLPYTAFAGDWTFTEALYGPSARRDAAYVDQVLRGTWRLDDGSIKRLYRIRSYCEPFLAHCLESVAWHDYDVVGFTSTFEQNVASLALARRLKRLRPDLVIAIGGANWEGEMGQELHTRFGFVDVVCSGEADDSFPELLRNLADHEPGRTRGVVYRDHGRSVATGPAPLIRDLDSLPYADFDDYFAQLDQSPVAADVTPLLLLETSRGCWWGAKHHCTFCGLNGGTMAFRSKSAERALAEIDHLCARHGSRLISVVDNILDMRYFRTLLPMLAEERYELNLFYEVKANLSLEQVRLLAAAGVQRIQPGIESFSNRVLALMRKGTTGLQNVQLLKRCREFGVKPDWNLLYGFPGEIAADYDRMVRLFDTIDFLDPPGAYGPVRLDRFSPYHADPAGFGIAHVMPMAAYRYLYPFPVESLRRIAYYFDFEYADGREPLSYAHGALERAQRWMNDGPRGGLWLLDREDGSSLLVCDRPGEARASVELVGWQQAAYAACDSANSLARLNRMDELAGARDGPLRGFLDWCVDRHLMLRDDDRYLALAIPRPARVEADVQRADPIAVTG